ncbi:ribonuclease HI family protein [Candidatus Sumerlaeota bacterium]|nr:ribonuclease HI family protein [Candidatus Sumerlaeota bacterium]
MSRVSANDIKKIFRELERSGGREAPTDRILLTLANHDAAVRMLADVHRDLTELEIRSRMAALARLLDQMRAWADPAARESTAERSDSPATEPRSPGADTAPPEPWEIENLAGHDKVKVFIDGGSKGNPGPASIGVVIKDLEDKTLYEDARFIGKATNNQAEYTALIAALQILLSLDRAPQAYFFSDSELLVRQMTGAYKVKSPLIQPLIAEAQTLRRRLPTFQIAHVRREANRRADQLANLAYKQARDAAKM